MRVLFTVSAMIKMVLAGFVVGVLLGVQLVGPSATPSCASHGGCVVQHPRSGGSSTPDVRAEPNGH